MQGSEVKVAQSCLTLCHPMDYTALWILQARIVEWVAFPFSRVSAQPRGRTQVSLTAGRFFTSWATREVPGKVSVELKVRPENRHTLDTRDAESTWETHRPSRYSDPQTPVWTCQALSNPTATLPGKREPEDAGRAEYPSLACLHVGRGRGHPPPPSHHCNMRGEIKSSSLTPVQSVEG